MNDEQVAKMKNDICTKVDELAAFIRSIQPEDENFELMHLAVMVVAHKMASFCTGVTRLTARDIEFMQDSVNTEAARRVISTVVSLFDIAEDDAPLADPEMN